MFDDLESLGCVSAAGNHQIYDFEIYEVDGDLKFVSHDDPDQVLTYDEVKTFFDKTGESLDEQLTDQGIIGYDEYQDEE